MQRLGEEEALRATVEEAAPRMVQVKPTPPAFQCKKAGGKSAEREATSRRLACCATPVAPQASQAQHQVFAAGWQARSSARRAASSHLADGALDDAVQLLTRLLAASAPATHDEALLAWGALICFQGETFITTLPVVLPLLDAALANYREHTSFVVAVGVREPLCRGIGFGRPSSQEDSRAASRLVLDVSAGRAITIVVVCSTAGRGKQPLFRQVHCLSCVSRHEAKGARRITKPSPCTLNMALQSTDTH